MGVQRAQYLTSVSYTGQPQHQPLSLSLQRPPLPTSPITTTISHIPNNQSRLHCLALSSLLLSAPHDIQTISASRTAPTGTPSPNNDIIIWPGSPYIKTRGTSADKSCVICDSSMQELFTNRKENIIGIVCRKQKLQTTIQSRLSGTNYTIVKRSVFLSYFTSFLFSIC